MSFLNLLAKGINSLEQNAKRNIEKQISPTGERFKALCDSYDMIFIKEKAEVAKALESFEYLYPIDNSLYIKMHQEIQKTLNSKNLFYNELNNLIRDAQKCIDYSSNNADIFYAKKVIKINEEFRDLVNDLKEKMEIFNPKAFKISSTKEAELTAASKKWLENDFSNVIIPPNFETDPNADCPDLLKKLYNAAKKNNPYAQYKLGEVYYNNKDNNSHNIGLAIRWLERAYKNNALRASLILVKCYETELQKEQDNFHQEIITKKCIESLYRSALYGDANSEYKLALISLETYYPIGRTRSEKKLKENYGIKWMIRAAQHNNDNAQKFLSEKNITY